MLKIALCCESRVGPILLSRFLQGTATANNSIQVLGEEIRCYWVFELATVKMSKLSQLQDVDLKLLRCFCTLVEEGSFAAAQAALNLSQSTLSEYLKTLELRLGVVLCQRGPKGFQLFDEGREIYLAARQLFESVESFKRNVSSVNRGTTGELVIAIQEAVIDNPHCMLPAAIERFSRTYSGIRLRVEMMLGFRLVGKIADGLIPVGIGVRPKAFETQVTFTDLFEENLALFCGKGHPLFHVPPEEIAAEKITSSAYCSRGHLEDFSAERRVEMPAGDIGLGSQAHVALILSGRNVGYLPTHTAQPFCDKGLLRPLLPDEASHVSRVGVMTGPGTSKFKVAQIFVQTLIDTHLRPDRNLAVNSTGARRQSAGKPTLVSRAR